MTVSLASHILWHGSNKKCGEHAKSRTSSAGTGIPLPSLPRALPVSYNKQPHFMSVCKELSASPLRPIMLPMSCVLRANERWGWDTKSSKSDSFMTQQLKDSPIDQYDSTIPSILWNDSKFGPWCKRFTKEKLLAVRDEEPIPQRLSEQTGAERGWQMDTGNGQKLFAWETADGITIQTRGGDAGQALFPSPGTDAAVPSYQCLPRTEATLLIDTGQYHTTVASRERSRLADGGWGAWKENAAKVSNVPCSALQLLTEWEKLATEHGLVVPEYGTTLPTISQLQERLKECKVEVLAAAAIIGANEAIDKGKTLSSRPAAHSADVEAVRGRRLIEAQARREARTRKKQDREATALVKQTEATRKKQEREATALRQLKQREAEAVLTRQRKLFNGSVAKHWKGKRVELLWPGGKWCSAKVTSYDSKNLHIVLYDTGEEELGIDLRELFKSGEVKLLPGQVVDGDVDLATVTFGDAQMVATSSVRTDAGSIARSPISAAPNKRTGEVIRAKVKVTTEEYIRLSEIITKKVASSRRMDKNSIVSWFLTEELSLAQLTPQYAAESKKVKAVLKKMQQDKLLGCECEDGRDVLVACGRSQNIGSALGECIVLDDSEPETLEPEPLQSSGIKRQEPPEIVAQSDGDVQSEHGADGEARNGFAIIGDAAGVPLCDRCNESHLTMHCHVFKRPRLQHPDALNRRPLKVRRTKLSR